MTPSLFTCRSDCKSWRVADETKGCGCHDLPPTFTQQPSLSTSELVLATRNSPRGYPLTFRAPPPSLFASKTQPVCIGPLEQAHASTIGQLAGRSLIGQLEGLVACPSQNDLEEVALGHTRATPGPQEQGDGASRRETPRGLSASITQGPRGESPESVQCQGSSTTGRNRLNRIRSPLLYPVELRGQSSEAVERVTGIEPA